MQASHVGLCHAAASKNLVVFIGCESLSTTLSADCLCWQSGSSAAVIRCNLLLVVAMQPTTLGCGAVNVVDRFISASHSPMLLSLTSPGKSMRRTCLMWFSASIRDSPQSTALHRTAIPAALCFPATVQEHLLTTLHRVFDEWPLDPPLRGAVSH